MTIEAPPAAFFSLWHGLVEVRTPQYARVSWSHMQAIAKAVAERNGMPLAQMVARGGARGRSLALQEAAWEIRNQTGASYPRIGALLKRDHSTIIHHCRVHEARLAEVVS